MLTRAQVAKRLGKSIATVRRLEGGALNPVVDSDGVHRFDPEEVERVAERGRCRVLPAGARGCGPARSPWLAAELERRGLGREEGKDEDDDEAHEEVWERREAELARLEELAREREQELEGRERSLREREVAITRERERTAAEALRSDLEFRRAVRAQVSQLIGGLDGIPPAAMAKIFTDEDMEFLASVVNDHLD